MFAGKVFIIPPNAVSMLPDSRVEDVGSRAYKYEQEAGNCPQCVCAAFRDVFGFPGKEVVKAGSGLGGGIGLTGNSCGALIGAAMVIGVCKGRDYSEMDRSTPLKSFLMVRKLVEKFMEEYDSCMCRDIQAKIMGRAFNLWDRDDYRAFEEAGAHDDRCPSVARNAAVWAAEILKEEGLI